MKSRNFSYAAAACLLIASALVVQSFQPAKGAGTSPAVSYTRGTLQVTLPYRLAHTGAGQLAIELLNPEGAVIAHAERDMDVSETKGLWRQALKVAPSLPAEDLVWQIGRASCRERV